jgi:hypothetical protein
MVQRNESGAGQSGEDDELHAESDVALVRNREQDGDEKCRNKQNKRLRCSTQKLRRTSDDVDPDRDGDEEQPDECASGTARDGREGAPQWHWLSPSDVGPDLLILASALEAPVQRVLGNRPDATAVSDR